jgi:hypothetical protein
MYNFRICGRGGFDDKSLYIVRDNVNATSEDMQIVSEAGCRYARAELAFPMDDLAYALPSRTAFLTARLAGAALVATAAQPAAASPASAERSAIDAVLRRAAHHKQVIATPRINGGGTTV